MHQTLSSQLTEATEETIVKRCFVIQPFDDDTYDKRFEDKPALNKAGLEAYRVDRDPKVEITIIAIEDGIRDATMCFADITEKNENVWYELGYAHANQKRVVLVCSKDRQHFPFDIRHRDIITYSSDSTRDHEKLKLDITARSKAYLKSEKTFDSVSQRAQIAPVEGLSRLEMYILTEVAGVNMVSMAIPSLETLQNRAVHRESWTKSEFVLSLVRLAKSKFIENVVATDPNGEFPYKGIKLTNKAWELLDRNSDIFVLEKTNP